MKGCFTALITPMHQGKVDYASLKKLIEFQIKGGIDGIIPCGTTGESPTLSHEEHLELIDYCIKTVNKRVKVVAGTGSNATSEALSLSKAADRAGADGLLLVTPYYNKPGQGGLYQHFKKTAQAVSCEIVLYNIPGRSNVNLALDTLKRLAKIENITTIKEASGSIDFAGAVVNSVPELALLSGNDSMNLPIASLGGVGCISVLSNLFPKETKQLFSLYAAGKVVAAKQLHHKFLPLINALFTESNPIPVKTACELRGLIKSSETRLPLTKAKPGTRKLLTQLLAQL